MILQKSFFASVASIVFVLSFAIVGAASALIVSCAGAPGVSSITWTASSAGGVAPVAFLWGNGSTSPSQIIAVSPGTYSMTLQGTDASSTVATTTCSATVAQPTPTVTSFAATPASITTGQSSVLSWVVANASSTSINNGVGTVTGTSVTVSPSITTTYQLSAVNPIGTTTANATVTVNATSTSPGGSLGAQIQALLAQIKALQAQILQLILQQTGGGGTATSTPPFPPGCFSFNRDLKHGDDGDDVRELQRSLASDDSSIFSSDLITGFFGPRTEKALMKFQRKFGIRSTGFFGPLSRGHFKENCGKADSDHDGIRNSDDDDDDNDGASDDDDDFPHNPNATSTTQWNDGRHGESGNKGQKGNKGKGNSGDDDDEDEEDDD